MKEVKAEKLQDLIEYKHYKRLSAYAWNILTSMNDEDRELLGKPFVKATDSVGAYISKAFYQVNLAKKIDYYIDANVALSESTDHWLSLILKRNIISKTTYKGSLELESALKLKLDSRIESLIEK